MVLFEQLLPGVFFGTATTTPGALGIITLRGQVQYDHDVPGLLPNAPTFSESYKLLMGDATKVED